MARRGRKARAGSGTRARRRRRSGRTPTITCLVKLYVATEGSFPIPLKYIDVTRTTDTAFDVMWEKHVDHYWNVDGDRELSEFLHWFLKNSLY